MIRFVQRVELSPKAMDDQGLTGRSSLLGEIKKLINVVSDWQADLVLASFNNLNELLENKDHIELIQSALKSIAEVKVIVVADNNKLKPHAIKKTEKILENIVDLPNLMILQAFETIFIDKLGLMIHGGYIHDESGLTYLPKLKKLDQRWPNLLCLPESAIFNISDQSRLNLLAFDYTTMDPLLKQEAITEAGICEKQIGLKNYNKSFFVKGLIDGDHVSWSVCEL